MDTVVEEKSCLNIEENKKVLQVQYSKASYITLLFGIILIILSIIAISLLVVFWNKENVTELQGRFGIVFDAGGSGTRMYVYEYLHNKQMKEIKRIKCEKKGFTNYGSRSKYEITKSLQKCISDASKEIPMEVISNTPLYLGATGGMRMLKYYTSLQALAYYIQAAKSDSGTTVTKRTSNKFVWKFATTRRSGVEKNSTLYDNVWHIIREVMNNASFPVKLARTLHGTEEGSYSWSTINTLLDNSKSTSGLYELGSSSFQISFEPHSSKTNIPNEYKNTVVVNEKKYTVYAHSYLCFGKTEFTRRYKAILIKDSNFSSIVEDPCSYSGFIENITSTDLWQSPCVVGDYARDSLGGSIEEKTDRTLYTLQGTGNFSQCFQNIISMFNATNCGDSCSINGIYQPSTSGLFTAIGGGVYYSSTFLKLPTPSTINAYENATTQLCSKSFQEVKDMPGYNSFVNDYCLADSYNLFLFKNVLKLGNKGKITFADEIHDQSLAWTLGFMYSHIKDMSTAILRNTRELSNKVFFPLIVISCLLLLAGLILVFVNCWKK